MPHDLAAVLAAYMIENARNRTPQTWLKITRTLSDCVDQHQGGVLNLRSEGWFLATFGDALAAVSCAVEIQRRLVAQDIDAEAKESPCLHIGLNFEVPPNDGEAWPPNKEDTVDRLVAMAKPGGFVFHERFMTKSGRRSTYRSIRRGIRNTPRSYARKYAVSSIP